MIFNKNFPRYEETLQILLDIEIHWQKRYGQVRESNHNLSMGEQEIYDLFVDFLNRQFPEDGLLVEDFPAKPSLNEYLWILDPIDGSSNFYTGVPLFSIVLSLVVDGDKPLLSFIVNLIRREIYIARGEENFLYSIVPQNWENISELGASCMKKGEYVLTGRMFGHIRDGFPMTDFRDSWWDLASHSNSYRQLGSIALQLVLDGWHRILICVGLCIRWFDIVAATHILRNWGYLFQITESCEFFTIYHPSVLPCRPLEQMIDIAREKWIFYPSNTFYIGR